MSTISRPRCHTMLLPVIVRAPHPSVAELRELAAANANTDPGYTAQCHARADVMERGSVPPAADNFDDVWGSL